MNKGPLYVTGCYVLWGLLPIFWKALSSLNPIYILACRIFWSLIFCAVIITINHDWDKIKTIFTNKKQLLTIVICSLLITFNWGSYIWAVNSNHILDSSLAYYMEPIVVIFIGAMFFKERLSRLQWLSVAFAALGVIIPIVYYGEFPFIALAMAGCFAIYGALKKNLSINSTVSIFMETLFTTPLAIVFIIYMEIQGQGALATLSGWQNLLLPLSGIVTSIPLILFAKGLQTTSYNLSGILMYINPTMEMLVGMLIYQERFTSVQTLTFAFVWCAVIIYLISMWQHRSIKAPDPAVQNSGGENKN